MERLSVDDMKAIELDIMDEIDRVCAAHGVEYFLGYGTLLGAVRHGGFIPWDDDMDIVMMRDQYELLMDHFNEWRTSERFKLVSYRDKSSIYQFAKIVDTTTIIYENFVGKKAATGVWVDIFPLDNFDPACAGLLKKHSRVGLWRSFAVADLYKLAAKLDGIAREVNEGASDRVIDVLGEGNLSKSYPKSLFKPVRVKFADREWRTPPAESDRAVHVMEAYRL